MIKDHLMIFVLFSSSAENDHSFPPLAIAQCSCHAKRGGDPPKNGRGGRKQHMQTSGARPWRWRVSPDFLTFWLAKWNMLQNCFFPSITTWCGFKYLYFVPYRTIQFHKYLRWVETTLPDDQWTVLDLPPHPVTVQAWLLRIPYSKCIDPGGDC